MINWETVAATLVGMLLIILLVRAVAVLHLWVWHKHVRWPWQREQSLLDHISEYNVTRAHRQGTHRFTDEELEEIAHLRRQLAWKMEQAKGFGHGKGHGTGHSGDGGKHSGTTGYTPGVSYE